MVLGLSSIINPLNVDLNANFFDIIAALIVSIMLVFITANKLYNKSAGIVMMTILALVISNSF
jgi:cation:H+ antiporter